MPTCRTQTNVGTGVSAVGSERGEERNKREDGETGRRETLKHKER